LNRKDDHENKGIHHDHDCRTGIHAVHGVAKAEETITPQEFATAVAEVPAKIGSHISNEIVEIKAYQAKSWAEAKAQWQGLINKFVKTESTQ